jgi:hypothetical protein
VINRLAMNSDVCGANPFSDSDRCGFPAVVDTLTITVCGHLSAVSGKRILNDENLNR